MAAAAAATAAEQQCYTTENWQAQLEEVLALQSIFAEDFRVIHIPGHELAGRGSSSSGGGACDSSNANGSTSAHPNSDSNSSSHSYSEFQQVEEQLQALLGSDPPAAAAAAVCGAPAAAAAADTDAPAAAAAAVVLLSVEALVHVELPAGQLRLLLDMPGSSSSSSSCSGASCAHTADASAKHTCSSSTCKSSSSSSSLVPFGPPVSYLPPICVQLSLPVGYPSDADAPPVAQLQACWLSCKHVQQLQQQLQQLWQEQGPGPVCFSWLEFLKEGAMQQLGIVKELVLHAPAVTPPAARQQQQQQQQQSGRQREQQAGSSSREGRAAAAGSAGRSAGSSSSSSSSSSQIGPKLSVSAAPFQPSVSQQQRQQQQQGKPLPQPGSKQQPQQKLQQQRQPLQQQQQPQLQGELLQLQTKQPRQQQQQQQRQKQQVKQPADLKQQLQQLCNGKLGHLPQQRQQQQQRRQQGRPPMQQVQGGVQQSSQQQQQVQGSMRQSSQQPQQQQQQQQEQEPKRQQQHNCRHQPQQGKQQQQHQEQLDQIEMPAELQQQQEQQQQQAQGHQQQQQQPGVEQLAVQLLRYSAAREAEAFMAASWTCNICFDQVPGSSCLRLPDCGHYYCTACLRSSAAAQVELGALENIRCPEPGCRRPLAPYVVKELLGEAGYARWEELLLQRTLDRMEDVVYCPRCETVCIEDKDHCAQCAKCLYVFCSFCQDSWHPGSECLDPHERLRVLERRKGASAAGDRRHEMDLVNQAMSLKYLTSHSRKCPGCGMATIKNEGCNKMTCGYCRAAWCWKCQQVISGYDHFRDSRCNMFDQEEINRWNAMMMWGGERAQEVEMGQVMLQVRGNAPGVQLCRCPVCGQENLREGRNNLLRCWSCNCHFCYSCRHWLRGRVGQHFIGKDACKQHG